MTQRIFDVENEKDMADLWDIVPDKITKITKPEIKGLPCFSGYDSMRTSDLIAINWHDKTEITRPIQECTEADIGKICAFWTIKELYIGELCHIESNDTGKYYEMSAPIAGNIDFLHCRRLTKKEIDELC